MDNMNEDEIKAPRPLRIIGKIIKYLFLAVVVLMVLWLTLSAVIQKGTPNMKKYIWTEDAAAQYSSSGGLKIWELTEYNHKTDGSELTEKLFFIDHIFYTEEASQFQFSIRYNVLNESAKKYISMSDENEPFVFVLKDNEGRIYAEYEYMSETLLMYGFYKLVFSDVDISTAKELSVYIYRNTGNDVKREQLVDICTVWYNDGFKLGYSLSRAEKKAVNKPNSLLEKSVTLNDSETKNDSETEGS